MGIRSSQTVEERFKRIVPNTQFIAFINGYFENIESKLSKLNKDAYVLGVIKGTTTAKTIFYSAATVSNGDLAKTIFYTKNRLTQILSEIEKNESFVDSDGKQFHLGFKYSIQQIHNNFVELCDAFGGQELSSEHFVLVNQTNKLNKQQTQQTK